MNPLRLAVVGTGALGRHHARILSGFEDVDLVAVVDTRPDIGAEVAKASKTRWVADYRDLLGQIDAAIIAVPTVAHLPVARDFLECGIPLLIEKPIAANVADAEELVQLAEKNGTWLQIGHVERFNPAFTAAQPFLAAPKYIRGERFSPYSFRSTDIGVVHDVLIHDLDLVLSMVQSPVRHVEAFGISVIGGHEDCVQARLYFEDGCIADLSANRVSPVARRNMQVWSAEGCVNIDFSTRETIVYAPGEALKYGTPPLERAKLPQANIEQLRAEVFGTFIKMHRPAVTACDALTEELREFLGCLRHGAEPQVGGREALRTMQIADRILEGVAGHAWDGETGAIGPFPIIHEPRKMAG